MNDTALPDAPAQPSANRTTPSPQTPLFDLLARSWSLGVGIRSVAMDRAGKAAGFALEDGRVALISVEDAESPLGRMRVEADTGRSIIRPREKPLPSPIMTPELAEGAPMLAASGVIGLIAAGRDGRIHRVTPRGQVIAMQDKKRPIFAIASDGTGRLAIARDGRTDLHEEEGLATVSGLLTTGAANALAFAPNDKALAVMLANELHLGQPREGYENYKLGGSGPLTFSADGQWIAGSNGTNGFWLMRRADGEIARIDNFRTPPSDIAFSKAGNAVFASGAFRAAGWSLAQPPLGNDTTGALRTGRSGLVLVERITPHPTRDLIAIGTADGAVSIARVGHPDEMALRQADGSAITALLWCDDGIHLAIGTASGEAALVTLPQQLFK